RQRILDGHVRVEADVEPRRGPIEAGETSRVVLQPARTELTHAVAVQLLRVSQAAVPARAGLDGLEVDLRRELGPALVRPAFARRTAVGRWRDQGAADEGLDPGAPRVFLGLVGEAPGGREERLAQER